MFAQQNGGAQNLVTVALVGGPRFGTPESSKILQQLKKATGFKRSIFYIEDRVNHIVLGGVGDLKAVSQAITFGQVEQVDDAKRLIQVKVRN